MASAAAPDETVREQDQPEPAPDEAAAQSATAPSQPAAAPGSRRGSPGGSGTDEASRAAGSAVAAAHGGGAAPAEPATAPGSGRGAAAAAGAASGAAGSAAPAGSTRPARPEDAQHQLQIGVRAALHLQLPSSFRWVPAPSPPQLVCDTAAQPARGHVAHHLCWGACRIAAPKRPRL